MENPYDAEFLELLNELTRDAGRTAFGLVMGYLHTTKPKTKAEALEILENLTVNVSVHGSITIAEPRTEVPLVRAHEPIRRGKGGRGWKALETWIKANAEHRRIAQVVLQRHESKGWSQLCKSVLQGHSTKNAARLHGRSLEVAHNQKSYFVVKMRREYEALFPNSEAPF